MKLPRDMDAPELIKALTIPNHSPLKLGTLAAILADVAAQRGVTKDDLLQSILQK